MLNEANQVLLSGFLGMATLYLMIQNVEFIVSYIDEVKNKKGRDLLAERIQREHAKALYMQGAKDLEMTVEDRSELRAEIEREIPNHLKESMPEDPEVMNYRKSKAGLNIATMQE